MCLTPCSAHALFPVHIHLLILGAVLTSVSGQKRVPVYIHCFLRVFLSYRPRIELLFYRVCISESILLLVFMHLQFIQQPMKVTFLNPH